MSVRSWTVRPEPNAEAWRRAGLWPGRTIGDDARAEAERDPDRVALISAAGALTVGALLSDAEALAASCRALGCRPGDVISFMLPNCLEAAVVNLAAAIGGFVVNPIVPIYREAETAFILGNAGTRMVFVDSLGHGFDRAAMMLRLAPALPELLHVVVVGQAMPGTLTYQALLDADAPFEAPHVDPSAVKMVLYTSGTTGSPKGVLHSHETLARAVAASSAQWGIRRGATVLMPSPVTHVSGYSNGLERPLLDGARTVLMERWDADAAVALIDRHGLELTVAATPFLTELAAAAERAGSTLPSLRVFACGGAAVPPAVVADANARLARAPAFRVYGSSEAPFVTLGFDGADSPALAAGTDGRIVDYEVLFLDAEGRPTAGEGEIAVRGPALFRGYLDPAQTAESFTADGYFLTGDLGRPTEHGGLVITGRRKDLIIRGGENISAAEIEAVLLQHPAVADVAVVAMPHERLGEGVCAVIVRVPEAALPTVSEIAAFLRTHGLAPQKFPERIEGVEALPRTAAGKVRKDVLRGLVASRTGAS